MLHPNKTYRLYRTINSLNGYDATAGSFQEMELNVQAKHCSSKQEK